MKKVSIVLLMCILLSFGINVVALANEKTITPKYNNSRSVEYEFVIEDNVAQISVLGSQYQPKLNTPKGA